MKLFDLTPDEKKAIQTFVIWHVAYLLLISLFFFIIYQFGWFKSHKLLKESGIFNYISPITTGLFVLISPWRKKWLMAVVGMYNDLEGDILFCMMAALIFAVGFYLYSGLIWALGSLGPSMFYI